MSRGRTALTRLGLMFALVVMGVFLLNGTANAQQQWLRIFGANGTQGQQDAYTEYSLDEGQTWQLAYLSGEHLWGMIPGTTSFVNCGPTQFDCLNRSVLYRIRFTIPDDATSLQVFQIIIIADNFADVTLNGTPIGHGEGRFYPSGRIAADALRTGLNEVLINLTDWGGSAGMSYRFDIYFDGPTPPTLIPADTVPPTITGSRTPAANGDGWNNSDVIVNFTCADNTEAPSCPGSVTVPAEGANQSVNGTAVDLAGKSATATVGPINVDKTAPETSVSPTGGQNQPASLTLTATDNLSGVANTFYTVDGGPGQVGTVLTIATEGQHTLTYWSVDRAGNREAPHQVVINQDTTAPTISGAPDREPNANGWYSANVIVTFTCNDTGGSGLARCTDAITLAEGARQSATGTAVDNAGNTASATVSGINIDKTNPVVTYRGNKGTYSVNEIVQIRCTSTDSLSGVAGGTCADISGPAYGFALGTNTLSAEATDKAGNTGAASVSFTVVVSNDSLCSLTGQFATKSGVANSLCAKLKNAAGQAAAGKREASNHMLQAYIDELAAQSGKALTAAQADILTRLAKALMQ